MIVNIPLTLPQREFVFSKAKSPALVAGLGAGKTYAATMRFVIQMMQEPGINTLLGMPTYDLLKLRAIPGFEEALDLIGLPYKTNKSDYAIEIIGYGKIYFRSYDRPERWIAFEVAKTLLDEIDTLPKAKAELVWRKATERTRQRCKSGNSIGAVTTPDQGINGFVYDKWVKKKQPGYEIIKASTMSNPYLPDGYVQQILDNYDPLLAQMYIEGDFVSLSDKKVYHFFDRKKHHKDREMLPTDKLHITIDFNIGGCCSNVFVIDGDTPTAVDEFVSHDTYDFVNNLYKYKGYKLTVYPDASGKANKTNAIASDLDIITNAGYQVDAPNANPFVRDRINCVNAKISHDQFYVNTLKCPELTAALEMQGYTDKGVPEKFDDHPAIDDWVDGTGYFIHRRYPISKPYSGKMRFG
jgi:hypothetical protein